MVTVLKHPEHFVDKVNYAIFKGNGRLPFYKAHYSKMTKAPFPDVITSSKDLL